MWKKKLFHHLSFWALIGLFFLIATFVLSPAEIQDWGNELISLFQLPTELKGE